MVKGVVKKWKCLTCGKWHKPRDCDDVNYFETGMRDFYGKEDLFKVYFPLFALFFAIAMVVIILL